MIFKCCCVSEFLNLNRESFLNCKWEPERKTKGLYFCAHVVIGSKWLKFITQRIIKIKPNSKSSQTTTWRLVRDD